MGIRRKIIHSPSAIELICFSISTTSLDTVLDDSDANITYSPNQWQTSPNGLQIYYYEQTMQYVNFAPVAWQHSVDSLARVSRTNILGAWASVLFYGNAISLYGATSSNHGLFSITLDGVSVPIAFNGSAPVNYTRWQNLLVSRIPLSFAGRGIVGN